MTIQVTIVSPNGNISGASLEKLTSCMSITSGTVRIISIPSGFVASRVTLLTKISGADLSTIVTNCVDVPILPAPSVAVQVTTVSPNGNNSGASLKNDAILTSSKTSGSISITVFPLRLVASITTSSGISTHGGVESIRIIFCCIVEILPITSVAVHVTMVSPTGNISGASFSMEITPTASDTVGVLS